MQQVFCRGVVPSSQFCEQSACYVNVFQSARSTDERLSGKCAGQSKDEKRWVLLRSFTYDI